MTKRDSFLLRLNPAVLDAVRRWADDELRSMNSQIEIVLLRALKEAGRFPPPKSGENEGASAKPEETPKNEDPARRLSQ